MFRHLCAKLFRTLACPSIRSNVRTSSPAPFRPTVTVLEDRVTPATYSWLGTFGSAATNPLNWQGPSQYSPPPGVNDDVYFNGIAPDCIGLGGAVASLHILSGYSGTVSLGGSLTVGIYEQTSANLSQPDSTNLTVNGTFTWTGGVLNSTPNSATVNINGGGSIAPANAGTVTLGSTIIFTGAPGSPKETITEPGTIALSAVGGGMVIGAFATLTAKTYTQGDIIGITKNQANATKIEIQANGTLGCVGPGTINYDLWMGNSGVLKLTGSVTVNLKGVVNPPPQNPTNYGQFAGSQLNIENGSVLTATNAFAINGTITLTMNPNLPAGQQTATMSGLLLIAGGTINFSPPINIGTTLVYGTFTVNGDVFWSNSTYMPNVDYTTAGLANKWVVNGKMSVDPNLVNNENTCIIQPVNLNGNNPPANSTWVVLDATTTNNIQPTIKKDGAGNLLKFTSVPVGNRVQWKLSP